MATYGSLPAEGKARIQGYLAVARPLQGEIYALALRAAVSQSDWNTGVSALIASLDAAEEIPNTTGLAGAREVTKENLANNLAAYIADVSGLSTSGHRENMLPACGAANLLTG